MLQIIEMTSYISDYAFGVRLVNNLDGKVHITFNARNDHDRQKFVEDLKEAILEVSNIFIDFMNIALFPVTIFNPIIRCCLIFMIYGS